MVNHEPDSQPKSVNKPVIHSIRCPSNPLTSQSAHSTNWSFDRKCWPVYLSICLDLETKVDISQFSSNYFSILSSSDLLVGLVFDTIASSVLTSFAAAEGTTCNQTEKCWKYTQILSNLVHWFILIFQFIIPSFRISMYLCNFVVEEKCQNNYPLTRVICLY